MCDQIGGGEHPKNDLLDTEINNICNTLRHIVDHYGGCVIVFCT